MRVVSGSVGGRRLECPPGRDVRPVMDRVKVALFNILGPDVQGARVLDLYAGSGSLGIEALSRGAASACFVERDPGHAAFAARNLETLGLDSGRVLVAGVREALVRLEREGLAFDLVLSDPPFARDASALPPDVFEDLAALTCSAAWAPGGLLVLEHRRGRPAFPQGLAARRDARDYGGSTLSFLERPPAKPQAGA